MALKFWTGGLFFVVGCGGASVPGGPDTSADGCHTDLECKGARICEDGRCVDPPSGSTGGRSGSSTSSGGGSVGGTSSRGGSSTGGSSTGGTSGNATGGSSGGASVLEVRHVALEATALVANAAWSELYAVVGGGAATRANELVTLDEQGNILSAVAIGSDPTRLALSDDGSTLWVGLHGAMKVRRVDLTGREPAPGTSYDLPLGYFDDPAAAGPLVVLPGTTASLAVSLHYDGLSPSFAGAVVIDDGVARPDRTDGHTGASRLTSGPPGFLFGFNNLHTGYGFYALRVSENGLTQIEHDGLLSGFDTDIVYANGKVFATSGEVVDVSEPSAPTRAGEFAYDGLVVYDDDRDDVVMLSCEKPSNYGYCSLDGGDMTLRLLDVDTFTQAGRQSLGLSLGRTSHLVKLDADTFAFIGRGPDDFESTNDPAAGVYIIDVAPWE